MSRADTTRSTRSAALYRRIRYDTGLEDRAFERLADLDLGGCREAFGDLASSLAWDDAADLDRHVVQLLLDVLQRVNHRVHGTPQDADAYQDRRVALIQEFAQLESAQRARDAFLPALNRLLVDLRRSAAQPRSLVERARHHIDRHYHERICLSSVARKLNVSSNHLSRAFRKQTGATLTSYIQRLRLEHARLLLAEDRHSISEIAYIVGYQHYRDFYRNFVKHENAAPREVRRRIAGGPAVPRELSATKDPAPPQVSVR